MLQRRAVQILHGDERFAAMVVNFVDGADVGMIQCRGGFRFALETAKRLRIFGHIVRQKFQRHETAELHIFSLVNHTHAATTEFFHDAVVRDNATNRRRNIRHERRSY